MSLPLKRLWKQSSSLIVLGRNKNASSENKFNYKVLVMERPSRSTFPGGIVFPGGVAEKSDESEEWLSYFKSFGIDDRQLDAINSINSNRPRILPPLENSPVKREISLRITAIRETFEELGILLCKNKDGFQDNSYFSRTVNNFDVKFWQNEVHNNSSKFFELCETLNVAPDLWGLHDWSAWLTPTSYQRRFETVFYIVALDDQPDVHIHDTEVKSSKWETPLRLLEEYRSENIWLPPPQLYELSKISKVSTIERLIELSKRRNRINGPGITLIYPIQFHMADGFVHCYPGDDFYPEKPNYFETHHNPEQFSTKTCIQFREMATNVHRTEHFSLHNVQVYHNLESFDDHIDATTKMESKL